MFLSGGAKRLDYENMVQKRRYQSERRVAKVQAIDPGGAPRLRRARDAGIDAHVKRLQIEDRDVARRKESPRKAVAGSKIPPVEEWRVRSVTAPEGSAGRPIERP